MSADQAQTTLDHYFEVMGSGEDFSVFYTRDVTWLMVETGQQVEGPEVVRDYILELHGRMFTQEQRHGVVVTDGHAYLEGDSVNKSSSTDHGLSYCLVYDFEGDRISAMRCYGNIATLMT